MEKIELQEVIDTCEEAESDYIKLYRPLLGYEDNIQLYRGIDDSLQEILEEIEGRVGLALPADLIELYLISNGGKYFDITLYHLTDDKNDINGLYYKNLQDDLREKYDIPQEKIIVGENTDGHLIVVGLDEEGYYTYFLLEKETKEITMAFDYLIEILALEINYHTDAFELTYDESEEA